MIPGKQDFGRMCRACLFVTESPLEELQSIYNCSKEHKMTLLELLELAVPQINWTTANDELPNTICSCCMNKLLKLYDFQYMCRKTDDCLRDILDKEIEKVGSLVEKDVEQENEWFELVDLNESDENEAVVVEKPPEIFLEMEVDAEKLKACIEPAQVLDFENNDEKTDILCTTVESIRKEKTTKVPKEFKCLQCDKVFKKAYALNRHQSVHNRSTSNRKTHVNKPYICEYCNKEFQQSCSLKDHVRTHTGEQPYLCSECGKAFTSASNMRQHLLRHTGLKRYECPDCPKKFPCLSDLASHKAIHKKIKPHRCERCGAAFGKPFLLKKHMMYHNGEKPHKCEYCEKRFVCADHMRRHARTHTGEKPYKCKYCPRAFAQSNDLMKHLRSHLGDNLYRCELCPCGFRLATELREHFTKHKNEDEETRTKNLKALQEAEAQLKITLPNFTSELKNYKTEQLN